MEEINYSGQQSDIQFDVHYRQTFDRRISRLTNQNQIFIFIYFFPKDAVFSNSYKLVCVF